MARTMFSFVSVLNLCITKATVWFLWEAHCLFYKKLLFCGSADDVLRSLCDFIIAVMYRTCFLL
jgi:hypothetical protein